MLSGTSSFSSPRASSMCPPALRSAPCSSSDLVTSSTKKGLPSALRAISAWSSAGKSDAASTAPAMRAISRSESGWSARRR